MKETFIIDETGEEITANVEGVYKVTNEDIKAVERARRKNKLKFFSNREKKRYLITRKTKK
jgi:hypothetical protein